ncbi:PRD domain-containing protein [Peribacillus sp. NPDC097224]|uniref:PRD domain-containing protein n=1 Tax=Peribacillus sp. NPDC097224 TaxID=3364399 RepID=UPI003821626E
MKIKKILNNNAVVVEDGQTEKIAIGTGIAFNKRRNDLVKTQEVEKLFVIEETDKFQQLILRIPEKHFEISEEIISYAEEKLGVKLSDHIHIVLTDHLSFAIEREQEGIHLQNKLLQEIKVLYKTEFEIGMWAIQHIAKRFHIEMPIDEAGYIALHIHTAKPQNGDMKETVRQTAIISDLIQTITEFLDITINHDDISYQRLITHLRHSISRVKHFELHTMDEEMLEMIKKKFPISYQCSKEVFQVLMNTYEMELPECELGYITLHIERLKQRWSITEKI